MRAALPQGNEGYGPLKFPCRFSDQKRLIALALEVKCWRELADEPIEGIARWLAIARGKRVQPGAWGGKHKVTPGPDKLG